MNPNEPTQPNPQPNKSSKSPMMLVTVLVVLLLIIVGVVLAVRHNKKTPPQETARQAIINVTATGFTPKTLHVKSGTTIVWQNSSNSPRHVASDPYPADNSVPGLNSQDMLPSSSYNYQVTSPQTIHYHDDTAPTHNGTIVVE